MLKRWIYEEEGQTLVEYGLLLALLALVVVGAMTLFSTRLNNYYTNANNKLPFDAQ